MPTPKRTKQNPYGLTYKQDLVIRDVVEKGKQGKNLDVVNSVEKFYNVKDKASARSVLVRNMKAPNFREALMNSLTEKKILGANSLTEERLIEGLDATTERGGVDYKARLAYIQEVNKVAGLYAPVRKETMSLNLDLTEEELDQQIEELQEELD